MESFLFLFRMNPLRLWYANLGGLHPNAELQEREHPFGWNRIVLLGSCHGVLCVKNGADDQIALWNPTTGDCNLLPPDAWIDLGFTACVYGFGYNDERDEYVLLRLLQTLRSPILSAVRIYRSGDGGWSWLRRILPYYLAESGRVGVYLPGVYLRGCLHWIMKDERNCSKVLVAFDLRTERFVRMGIPRSIDHRRRMDLRHRRRNLRHRRRNITGRMDLALLGEQLCLTTRDEPTRAEPRVVNVWIMREYGLRQPWHQLFSLRNHLWTLRPIRPMAYSQDGSRVLVGVGSQIKTLGWYNLNTNEVEQCQLHGMPRYNEFEFGPPQLDGREFEEATCLSR